VIRILKAFVDAQWLSELDDRLKEYQARLADDSDIETDMDPNPAGDGGGD